MPLNEFKLGTVIYSEGKPIQDISFIIRGEIQISFNGKTLQLGQGDIVGLCGISTGIYTATYTALSDVALVSYPYDKNTGLTSLFRRNLDAIGQSVESTIRQLLAVLNYWVKLKKEADTAYDLLTQMYSEYERLCQLYSYSFKRLPGFEEMERVSLTDPIKDWVNNYYTELDIMDFDVKKNFFYYNSELSVGFFHKGAEDMRQIIMSCEMYQDHLKKTVHLFLSYDGHDLLAVISDLHISSLNIKGAHETLNAMKNRIAEVLDKMTFINSSLLQKRLSSYNDQLKGKLGTVEISDAPVSEGLKQNLADSLNKILEYSGCSSEICNKFARLVGEYYEYPDKSGSDDKIYSLRREIAELFNILYKNVFINTLEDPAPDTIIKMFLNFGYVDADLAGHANAEYLYSIADSFKGDPDRNVYTISEWLTAIYKGEQDPSRNDFDLDYPAYLKELKQSRKIDAEEEAKLLNNNKEKLLFEMDQVFPTVNKITFGRITSFCPLFSEDNAQRNLNSTLVSPNVLYEIFDEIRQIDFSAYYREVSYSNIDIGVPKEFIHVEVLPTVILMPNVGLRGTMWQEIEGRKYTTPARMYLPIFYMENLKNLIIKLTAEFRWELCKRVQGPRWSVLSYPSLTSEFFDYLQFYKSNKELSLDAKSMVKADLSRARNSYKEVFSANYADWILYESKGSLRLNKTARRVMLDYCPFKAEIREKLKHIPQYSELFKIYGLKVQRRVRQLQMVIQKVENADLEPPKELLNEVAYLES